MRTFYWALRTLLSHWWRHRVQLASVLAGLWLATALLTGVQALNSQARDSYARASQLIGGAAPYRLVSRDGGRFEQAVFVQLRLAGWPVSPLLQGRLELDDQRQPGHVRLWQVLGIDPVSLPRGSTLAGQSVDSDSLLAFIGVPGSDLGSGGYLATPGTQGRRSTPQSAGTAIAAIGSTPAVAARPAADGYRRGAAGAQCSGTAFAVVAGDRLRPRRTPSCQPTCSIVCACRRRVMKATWRI